MSYRFLDDIALADVAFEARATSLPELFAEAAEALLAVQIANPHAVIEKVSAPVKLEQIELDLLLYHLLQELIFLKDKKRWLLRAADLDIAEADGQWRLSGTLRGERLDPERHDQKVDVKAVTLHRLEVTSQNGYWTATVVLDI